MFTPERTRIFSGTHPGGAVYGFYRPGNGRNPDCYVTARNSVHDDGVRSDAAIVTDVDWANHLGSGSDDDAIADARRAAADTKIAQGYAVIDDIASPMMTCGWIIIPPK